jgi:hypothetical protein
MAALAVGFLLMVKQILAEAEGETEPLVLALAEKAVLVLLLFVINFKEML